MNLPHELADNARILYRHVPHPHRAARREQGPVTLRPARMPLNDRLAARGTAWFGTMWAFYAFVVYGALGAIFTAQQATLLYWSNWIQLWSLPLLMVGAVVLGQAAEKRNQQAFDDTEMILHGQEQQAAHLAAQDAAILEIRDLLLEQDRKLAAMLTQVSAPAGHQGPTPEA